MYHLVLTRLNVRIPWMKPVAWTDADLRVRADKFGEVCLPSVAGQTRRDFTWVVFASPSSPAWLKDRLAASTAEAPMLRIVELDTYDIPAANARALAFVPAGEDRVLTTRLDSDDALSRDHVERLRARAAGAPEGRVFFNFVNGISAEGGRYFRTRCRYSAFFSVLEDRGGLRTGYDFDHRTIDRDHGALQIGGGPGWMQTVHAANTYTESAGSRLFEEAAARVRRRFDLRCRDEDRGGAVVALRNAGVAWSRATGRACRAWRRVLGR